MSSEPELNPAAEPGSARDLLSVETAGSESSLAADSTHSESAGNHRSAVGTEVPAEFLQLFTRSQRRLFLFILAQVGNPYDAEEVLQETNLIVWSKAQQFELGTNFIAWASQIAMFEVYKHRSRQKKQSHSFSDEFLSQVAEESAVQLDELEERRQALAECLKKLRPQDRELIQTRYAPGERGKDLAAQLGRPANSVYQSLGRIRKTLWECIQRRLAATS
jgi:RNA polymerase sigma-70 factor, ECF subfamily